MGIVNRMATEGFVEIKVVEIDDSFDTHANNTSNPHNVTKTQVGLSNVADILQYSAENEPPYPVTSVNGMTGDININIIPDYSNDNEGQFLKIINGIPVWTTLLNAEENEF